MRQPGMRLKGQNKDLGQPNIEGGALVFKFSDSGNDTSPHQVIDNPHQNSSLTTLCQIANDLLVTGAEDGTIRLWKLTQGGLQAVGETRKVEDGPILLISPSERIGGLAVPPIVVAGKDNIHLLLVDEDCGLDDAEESLLVAARAEEYAKRVREQGAPTEIEYLESRAAGGTDRLRIHFSDRSSRPGPDNPCVSLPNCQINCGKASDVAEILPKYYPGFWRNRSKAELKRVAA